MARTNRLVAKIHKLTAQLEKAKRALRKDIDRRKAAIEREFAGLGITVSRKVRDLTTTPAAAPKRKQGKRSCRICGKRGHDARNCPQKKAKVSA